MSNTFHANMSCLYPLIHFRFNNYSEKCLTHKKKLM